MIPLALTSNDWSVRRLGRFWRFLHRLTYLAAILAGVHFIMLSKGFDVEALAHMDRDPGIFGPARGQNGVVACNLAFKGCG